MGTPRRVVAQIPHSDQWWGASFVCSLGGLRMTEDDLWEELRETQADRDLWMQRAEAWQNAYLELRYESLEGTKQ